MNNHVLRLLALTLAAIVLLDTASSSASQLSLVIEREYANPLTIAVSLAPMAIATAVAFLIYRYGKRLDVVGDDNNSSLVLGGAKLLGLYFVVTGCAELFYGIALLSLDEPAASAYGIALSGFFYTSVGCLLLSKSKTISRLLDARSDTHS